MTFRFDLISFLLGMVIATIVWWAISLLRPIVERWFDNLRVQRAKNEQKRRSGLEGDYLQAVFKQSQGIHLAASLFPLDEIAEIPRLLAPPIIFEPNTPHKHLDIVEQTLPYLPDYPELGAFYNAPSLTPLQAISGGMHLAIIGQAGSGKTTALAYVAAQLSRSETGSNESPEYIPFLIHAADLGLVLTGNNPRDVLSPIVEKIASLVKIPEAARIRKFAEFNFGNGQALLLLDGVDELPQAGVQEVSAYLKMLLQQYPKSHIILAATPEYVDGLTAIGFAPMAIMPWNVQQQTHFIKTWGELWNKYLGRESWAQQLGTHVDSLLLNRWLEVDNFALTPLEFTLKVWGAYAGDIRSGNPIDTIEAHIKRQTPASVSLELISALALQAVTNEMSIFDGRQATEWVKTSGLEMGTGINAELANPFSSTLRSEDASPTSDETTNTDAKPSAVKTSGQTQQLSNISIISELTISGMLSSHNGNRLRFSHPLLLGYLAGKSLSRKPTQSMALLNQKDWLGQTIALRFLAVFGDVTEIVAKLLTSEDPILMRPLLTAGRLLRDTNQPRNNAWRTTVISELVKILNYEDHPVGLRGQAMMALALSCDNKINVLFRQLLLAESNHLRQLAALGSGLTRDTKAIETLENLTSNSMEFTRSAACLALVEIGTPPALEAVAVSLLHGDEQLRTYAAEALANNLNDGREALREGITSEDILVRRAILYGLSRIDEPWAVGLIEQSQVNDEQWAVRNLAVEILTDRQENQHIPKLPPTPHETPWVIEFAGKYGMGVSPSQPANNIFLLALKENNSELFRPSLNYLKSFPTNEVYAAIYPFFYGIDMEAREAVFETLTHMARAGNTLPHPKQFGLG